MSCLVRLRSVLTVSLIRNKNKNTSYSLQEEKKKSVCNTILSKSNQSVKQNPKQSKEWRNTHLPPSQIHNHLSGRSCRQWINSLWGNLWNILFPRLSPHWGKDGGGRHTTLFPHLIPQILLNFISDAQPCKYVQLFAPLENYCSKKTESEKDMWEDQKMKQIIKTFINHPEEK